MYVINKSEAAGKNLLIGVIAVYLGFAVFELITSLLYVANVGPGRVMSQIIDLALSTFFSYKLYKGKNWARILIGVLLILAALPYLFRIVEGVIASVPTSLFMLYMGVAFVINLVAGIVLLRSNDIRNFIEFQSRKAE